MEDAVQRPKKPEPEVRAPEPNSCPEPMFDLIELFFFAYRDFVGDADRLLLQYKFGRAHHRVLYFVERRPGLSIAELLDLLKITKQSLSRVLKDLVDQAYVEQRSGQLDRRQRLLYPTEKGRNLAHEIAGVQSRRFERVLRQWPGSRQTAAAFLAAMMDPPEKSPTISPLAAKPWAAAKNRPESET